MENEPATSQSPLDPVGQVRGAIVLARLGDGIGHDVSSGTSVDEGG